MLPKFKLVNRESGQAMIMVVVLMTVLFGMASLTLDVGRVYLTKSRLQNTADASALVGAQDILNGNADNSATSYALLNGVSQTEISLNPTNTDPAKYEVVCARVVPYTVARVLGLRDINVQARAVAAINPVNSVSGCVPLGIEQQTFVYGQTYQLKENGGEGQYHGNFGCLALGGNGANNFRDNLKYGYSGVLTIGDEVDTEPGNMAGPTSDGIEYRYNLDPTATYETVQKGSGRLVVVPVVDTMDVNGRKEVTIVGFAVFFLETAESAGGDEGNGNGNHNGNNSDAAIYGEFMEMVIGNSTGGTVTPYGAYKVHLVE